MLQDIPNNKPAMHTGLTLHTRNGGQGLEGFEKPIILPTLDNTDPTTHAWADARFAVDIMAEHALFFTLLMPPEVAEKERAEALGFFRVFTDLFDRIDTAPRPKRSELKQFAGDIVEQIKPFIDYKIRMGDAQRSGTLRSLAWPLFFHHTQHEAECWSRRLTALKAGLSWIAPR